MNWKDTVQLPTGPRCVLNLHYSVQKLAGTNLGSDSSLPIQNEDENRRVQFSLPRRGCFRAGWPCACWPHSTPCEQGCFCESSCETGPLPMKNSLPSFPAPLLGTSQFLVNEHSYFLVIRTRLTYFTYAELLLLCFLKSAAKLLLFLSSPCLLFCFLCAHIQKCFKVKALMSAESQML